MNNKKKKVLSRRDFLVGMGGGMEEFENRYMNNGILDFLLEERKAGRIRNLGFSYHGDVGVFDYLLSRHDEYKWDFVQIQLNYLDWKYSKQINPRNTGAEYLYGELKKRGIPALQCAEHHRSPPQAARAGDERGFVGVSFCRQPAGRAYRVERHDPYGAFAGQPAHLRSLEAADEERFQVPARDGYTDDAVRYPMPSAYRRVRYKNTNFKIESFKKHHGNNCKIILTCI